MPTQTEFADAEARAAELFKQKMQELEAMKTLYKKLLNESKKQEIIARDAGNYCDRPGDINQDGAKTCDDCCEELYWSKKRESELCPNCDIDESDDEEEKCNTCGKNIDDDDDDKKCGEGCPEYDSGWNETHP